MINSPKFAYCIHRNSKSPKILLSSVWSIAGGVYELVYIRFYVYVSVHLNIQSHQPDMNKSIIFKRKIRSPVFPFVSNNCGKIQHGQKYGNPNKNFSCRSHWVQRLFKSLVWDIQKSTSFKSVQTPAKKYNKCMESRFVATSNIF